EQAQPHPATDTVGTPLGSWGEPQQFRREMHSTTRSVVALVFWRLSRAGAEVATGAPHRDAARHGDSSWRPIRGDLALSLRPARRSASPCAPRLWRSC